MNHQPKAALTIGMAMKFRIRGGKTVMVLPDGTWAIERKEVIVDTTISGVVTAPSRHPRQLKARQR